MKLKRQAVLDHFCSFVISCFNRMEGEGDGERERGVAREWSGLRGTCGQEEEEVSGTSGWVREVLGLVLVHGKAR